MTGWTHNEKMICTAKQIWHFSISKEITITAEYLSGSLNVRAALVAKNFLDFIEQLRSPRNISQKWTSLPSLSSDPSLHSMEARSSESSNRYYSPELAQKGTFLYIYPFFTNRESSFESENRRSLDETYHPKIGQCNVGTVKSLSFE